MFMPMRVGLPSYPYSFLIENRGNLIVAQDSRGRIRFSGTDAASVIQSAINALTSGGKIFIKRGTYTINSTLTIPTTPGLKLEIEGEEGTILQHTAGTLDSMLDALATEYIQGDNAQIIILRNLSFKFQTKDANSIGLDLQYITPSILENVSVKNINSTKQGTGIKLYPVGNPGGAVWNRVSCFNFGTNFYLGFDHLIGNFLFSQDPSNYHFQLQGNLITLIHPHAFLSAENATSALRFGINGYRQGIVLINPNVEKNANGTKVIDYYAGYGYKAYVYNLTASSGFTDPIIGSEDLPYVKFINCPLFVTQNGGTATFSGNGSTKTFTIAHGLASAPSKVLVTAGSDAAKGDFYATADATNITVTYGTAPPSGTNNVVLYWYAEV
jgi:hypothetical protein